MIASLAWKNVWRNRSRSLTVIAAVTVGVFASVFALAAVNSTVVQRISAAVNEELSHIQIDNKEFRSSHNILSTIENSDSVVALAGDIDGVTGVTRRIIVTAVASTARATTGVEINGIDTGREEQMFSLSERVIAGSGSYFGDGTLPGSAYIGEQLALRLHLVSYVLTPESFGLLREKGMPDEVIRKLRSLENKQFNSGRKLTESCRELLDGRESERWEAAVVEAAWSYREGSRFLASFIDVNGKPVRAVFRICGIWRTSNNLFEATSLFVPIDELRRLTAMDERACHRIIVRLAANNLTDKITGQLKKELPGLRVMSWKEIQPDLAMISDYILQIYAIFMIIIFAAFSFGIVNTMLMSLLERTRETGMLMALGMSRRQLLSMIMLESLFLSAVGGFAGMAVSAVVIAITGHTGINLVKYSEGLSELGYSAHLYPTIGADFFFMLTGLIVLTGVLASLYPAHKALQIIPAEALRRE